MARLGLTMFISLATIVSCQTTLCRTPDECGHITPPVDCGSDGNRLRRFDEANICVGFQAANGSTSNGTKAVYKVKVDEFSQLRVDALRLLMGAAWSPAKELYSAMWIGLNGRRTIGQQRGTITPNGDCNVTTDSTGATCYGWTEHNKPVITPEFELSSGLTAIIHLDGGRLNRIVWDSSCSLCPDRSQELTCAWDQTDIACVGGLCYDCYAKLTPGACSASSEVCSPSVYIAWVGTDTDGSPLMSAGSVLSRFASGSLADVGDQLTKDLDELARDFER